MRIAPPVGAVSAALAVSVAVPAAAEDYNTVQSFDGTPITFYWFPAIGLADGQTAPTVLQGPGFGGKAQSDPDAKSSSSATCAGPATTCSPGTRVASPHLAVRRS